MNTHTIKNQLRLAELKGTK